MSSVPTLEFELSRQPLSPSEGRLFAADLAALGLSFNLWPLFNATLATRTSDAAPQLLRAYRRGELMAVALLIDFTRPGRSLFRTPLLQRALDAPRIPQFIWNRLGAGIDQYSNPGFVREGLDRSLFVEAALRFLLSRYLLGCLIDRPEHTVALPVARVPHFDYGVIDLRAASGAAGYGAAHSNLPRKLRKFRNKGGTLEVIEGPISAGDLERIDGWLRALEPDARLTFQDNYANMVRGALQGGDAGTVHILARLQRALVGYQSFVCCGDRLSCLSGVFDRSRASTYHAYEAIIVESVAYAASRGLAHIDYGPVVNPTKAAMMTHFVPTELRYYSRLAPLRGSLGWLLYRSRLSPHRFAAYMGQPPVWTTLEVGAPP